MYVEGVCTLLTNILWVESCSSEFVDSILAFKIQLIGPPDHLSLE